MVFISICSFVFPSVSHLFLTLTFCWELIQVAVVFLSTCPETLWRSGHFGHIPCPAPASAKPVFCEVGRGGLFQRVPSGVGWHEHQWQPMPVCSEQPDLVSATLWGQRSTETLRLLPSKVGAALPRPPASPPARTAWEKSGLRK